MYASTAHQRVVQALESQGGTSTWQIITSVQKREVHSHLGNVSKIVEVLREDAPRGHAGAHPGVTLLLLWVHPQHVAPLPHIVILRTPLQHVDQPLQSCKTKGR